MIFYKCKLKQEGSIFIYEYDPEAPPVGSIARENPPHPNVVTAKNRDHLEPTSVEIFDRLQRTGLKDLSPASMQKVNLLDVTGQSDLRSHRPRNQPRICTGKFVPTILGSWA